MTSNTKQTVQFTVNDIEIGLRVFEALAQQAQSTQASPITYGDLLTSARHLHPRDEALGRAVPVGIGTKLLFVESFCASQSYPNLTCLAVNQQTMRPGPGYKGDWEADKRAVASFDWSVAASPLAVYAAATRANIPPRLKPRKERPADVSWYAYFCSHRKACETLTQEDKKEIINLLMAGLDPETALGRVMAAKADVGQQ